MGDMIDLPLGRMIQGDNLLVLPTLPDECVDAIITDPPFGTASDSKVQQRGRIQTTFAIAWDWILPVRWLAEAARVLKPGGSIMVFTDANRTQSIWRRYRKYGLHPLQQFGWIKNNPGVQPRQNFQSCLSLAVFGVKPGRRIFWGGGGITPNVFVCPTASGHERTSHPTQKPLKLMRHLVRLICPPGGVVLDPFAGSGSTLEAAIMEGRRYLGIELEPEYVTEWNYRVGRITLPMVEVLEHFAGEQQLAFDLEALAVGAGR
jgi:site-specific DNA-methyltransferase (adenine-specific)